MIEADLNACCAIAPGHRLPWRGCTNTAQISCFTTVPTLIRGGKCADLLLTPLELIDTIAALVPPPRKHRLRTFGALALNCPLHNIVTALVRGDSGATSKTPVAGAAAAIGSSARYAWASLNRAIFLASCRR